MRSQIWNEYFQSCFCKSCLIIIKFCKQSEYVKFWNIRPIILVPRTVAGEIMNQILAHETCTLLMTFVGCCKISVLKAFKVLNASFRLLNFSNPLVVCKVLWNYFRPLPELQTNLDFETGWDWMNSYWKIFSGVASA